MQEGRKFNQSFKYIVKSGYETVDEIGVKVKSYADNYTDHDVSELRSAIDNAVREVVTAWFESKDNFDVITWDEFAQQLVSK